MYIQKGSLSFSRKEYFIGNSKVVILKETNQTTQDYDKIKIEEK